jgi:hypothetical protein
VTRRRPAFGSGIAPLLLIAGLMPNGLSAHHLQPAQQAAEPVTIGFDPPLDTPLRLNVERAQRARDGRFFSFSASYIIRFERAGRGFRLTSRLIELESDAPQRLQSVFGGMLAPMKNVDVHYLVAADGSSIDLTDGEALWETLRLVDATRAQAGPREEAGSVVSALLALSPAQREDMLSADIDALVVLAGHRLAAGVLDGGQGARAITQSDAVVDIVEESAAPTGDADGNRFETRTRWRVGRSTGLLMSESSETRIVDDDSSDSVQARILRTLEPLPPTTD